MSRASPNFDRVACLYRWAEYAALGTLLERTRLHFLPRLVDRRAALVLGDGDGRFLAALLCENHDLHATAVDSSAAMLHLLETRCAFASHRLKTVQQSLLTFTPSEPPDLIVSHFVLDCFTQPEIDQLTQRLACACPTGAFWLVSDFGLPRHSLPRFIAAIYIRALYFAFRVLTGLRVTALSDPQTSLHDAGFERIARKQWLGGFLYSELWQLRTMA